jgi:hypothetical protein
MDHIGSISLGVLRSSKGGFIHINGVLSSSKWTHFGREKNEHCPVGNAAGQFGKADGATAP